MPEIPELMTAKAVSKSLNCSLPLVYKMAGKQLPCVRWESEGTGGRKKTVVRFKSEDVIKFIETNYQAQK
jgi:hypothetical protein